MITHIRHTTAGRTHLDEGPARRRDLYLTTHNTHKRQTSVPPVEFEPTILVNERPQTHALDRTATGIGNLSTTVLLICANPNVIDSSTVYRNLRPSISECLTNTSYSVNEEQSSELRKEMYLPKLQNEYKPIFKHRPSGKRKHSRQFKVA
jgi:hypothetical protein